MPEIIRDKSYFMKGLGIEITGLTTCSLGLYATTSPFGSEAVWGLAQYFQLVFGLAGTLLGFTVAMIGFFVILDSIFEGEEDEESDES